MNRTEIEAAFAITNEKFSAGWAFFEAARNHYFAIKGIASKSDDAEFVAAQAALEVVRQEYDVAFLAMSELPEDEEMTDDSEQLQLFAA